MLPFYDLYPHRVERVTSVRHAVKRFCPARTRASLVKRSEIITKMSRKLFFLLSPSAVLFYFLFTVRVPHKKTINLLFTDHQEIVSRRGLFTTHVRVVAYDSKWCTLYDWRARKPNEWYILSLPMSISRHPNQLEMFYCLWISERLNLEAW